MPTTPSSSSHRQLPRRGATTKKIIREVWTTARPPTLSPDNSSPATSTAARGTTTTTTAGRRLRAQGLEECNTAQHEDRILLIGGSGSSSTEWISVDGGESQIGPCVVRHGSSHCTIQVSSNLIVVTGGYKAYDYVTEYQLTGDNTGTVMTSLINGRYRHACGVYWEAGGQQVRISW